MRKRTKNILSCMIFLALLVVSIGTCADLLEYKAARKKYTPFYESETNFDVIFLGTSHMWNHVLPMELWDEYGISSYNWAYSNCTPAEDYYLLQDIVKYTSPKLVVIDVYGIIEYDEWNNGKYRTDRIEQQHVQFDSLPLSANKIEASRDVFDDYAGNNDFIWNFIMYHNRWAELGKDDFAYDITTEKGSYFLSGLGSNTYEPIPEGETMEIDSVCYPYFMKILEFCEENDIQVLCTYLPYAAGEKQQRVANSIGDVIEEYPNCSYVNMLNEGIVDFSTDLSPDNGHLNFSGARKTTSWLGAYISEHYELDDYTDHEAWRDDYAAYSEYKIKNLTQQTTLAGYLSLLNDPDYNVTAEIYDSDMMSIERLTLLLDNAKADIRETAPADEQVCMKLIIESADDGSIIEEALFAYEDGNKGDIMTISKIVEE